MTSCKGEEHKIEAKHICAACTFELHDDCKRINNKITVIKEIAYVFGCHLGLITGRELLSLY